MTTLYIAAFILLALIVTVLSLLIKRNTDKKEEAELAAAQLEYDKQLLANLRQFRNTTISLKANRGRITGQIVQHQIVWVATNDAKGKPINLYGSVPKLFEAEELDPAEVEELELIEAALADVRRYKDTELKVRPQGSVTHIYPRVTVVHYMAGTLKVCDREKMRVVIGHNADHTVFVKEVQISPNFIQCDPEVYDFTDERYVKAFDQAYNKDKGLRATYKEELDKLREIQSNIKNFNKHVTWFKYDQGKIIGFVPPIDSFEQQLTPEEKEAQARKESEELPIA